MVKSSCILDDLHELLSVRFDEIQDSLANHRKNCVGLYKLHVQAGKSTAPKLDGEVAFEDIFIGMLSRVLAVKKGPAADRVVRFVGTYVKHIHAKVLEDVEKKGKTVNDDTLAARFTTHILRWLLEGFLAKNKVVRGRTVQIVSEMIAHIGDVDEDTYDILRDGLIERICDKEPPIRSHAVAALSKLAGTEDPDELRADERTILELLLDAVTYDPSAEVRRAALVNLPIAPQCMKTILTRTRDTDPVTRKLVYSTALPKLGDPRKLTIAQREDVVRTGLGDREPAVRVAVSKMLANWFDLTKNQDMSIDDTWEGDDSGVMKGFIQFICLFDVVGPGVTIAVDAVLSQFNLRPALLDAFIFTDQFWKTLTPESAVLARVFVEHCHSTENQQRVEEASLPVVTAFAFYLQGVYNDLIKLLNEAALLGGDGNDEESEQREEDIAKREAILNELLQMALKLDYMDELGRRKVFSVVKNMLAHPELPPGLIEPCLDVLKEISPSERELIRVVVEIVVDLRDDDDNEIAEGDISRSDTMQTTIRKEGSIRRMRDLESMSPEEKREADLMDMRCLTLCIGMLERINGTFEDNSTLEGMLADLIIPAVKRKELPMREKGLVSLGLCCLIAKLFLSQIQNAPEELRLKVLQVVFDLLVMYEYEFLSRSEEVAEQIITFLVQTLEVEESNSVQAVLCAGLCKLLLAGLVRDPKVHQVLTTLVLTYISPSTSDNSKLRQCLSYFFPVYCYSSLGNQARLQSIFINAFNLASHLHDELEEEQEMISLQQFALLLMDWTNPEKSVDVMPEHTPNKNFHAYLAVDILLALYDEDKNDNERKVLCQLLSQLNIIPELDHRTILKLNVLLEHLNNQCPLNKVSLDKIVERFRTRVSKLFSKDLEQINAQEYMDDDFHDLYQYIGVAVPTAGNTMPARFERASKRNQNRTPSPVPQRRSTRQTPKVKTYVEEEEDEEEDEAIDEHEDEEAEVEQALVADDSQPSVSDEDSEVADSGSED
ncbi:ARM repeat-containing protein [Guyanagaster necrorhizus]|uniref:ARM repeat-containing protein n=1 Tax=Guyanagaster necrorhizus TaxID=856835 RepID=A0A9P7VYC6_9AGAR|nr:ARM repeat-containing protein [Guyanagaster necrorhizus MCA 3950]KAG7448853.1 ARM repeat-containing protein [Guyanagaster necrorhizus MCA 3950]